MQRLTLEHISLDYGRRRVLHDISLEVCRGQVLVVTGSNGSGKSTLLRVLAGLQRPQSGTVHYANATTHYTPAEARQSIGWMGPDLMLYRELSGHENLRFFADVRGVDVQADAIEALLDRVGLHGRGADQVATYSSGMTHRLRYAYALLHQPVVLLLDEPSVMLDEHGHALLESVVTAQRAVGMTIIATNDPREQRFADVLVRLAGAA